jgi:hypothetical protein
MKTSGTWKQKIAGINIELTINNGECEYLAEGDVRGGGTCEDIGDVMGAIANAISDHCARQKQHNLSRTSVIISKRGEGYISTVQGKFGGGHSGARAGLTPYDAAAQAANLMIRYAQCNEYGGTLMAPPEVLELVPEHLREIPAK